MNTVIRPGKFQAQTGSDAMVSERFADFAARLDPAHIPAEVREHARYCMLDALGIGLASSTFDFAHRSAGAIAALAGAGEFPVIGMPLRLPLRDAVMLNGTLIHGLDYDDTHARSVVHCTASALPVVLAHGQANAASGEQVMAAYVLAVEVSARIGQVAQGRFQRRGHHPTGMVAAFGATLAAGYLGDLTAQQMMRAQGVVLSMAAGNLEFLQDGDWTKRMHPGWAGVCASTAVALAKAGFLGPKRAYEGRYGLYNLHLGADEPVQLDGLGDDLGAEWELLNVALKPFPACHFNHAFADAALALRSEHDLTANNIRKVTAFIHPNQVEVVCEPKANKWRPRSEYDAKFSLPFVVACCLARGRFTLSELDDECLADTKILDLCERVEYAEDEHSTYPQHYCGELLIETTDGRVLRHREHVNRGARENPLAPQDILDKFFDNATRAISRRKASRIHDALMRLEGQGSVDALMRQLTL